MTIGDLNDPKAGPDFSFPEQRAAGPSLTGSPASGPRWFARRPVQVIATAALAGLLGVGVGASIGVPQAELTAAEARATAASAEAEQAEAELAAMESRLDSTREAAAEAQSEAAAAKVEAQEAVKADVAKIAADRAAFEAKLKTDKAALEARAKEVGIAEAEAAANTFDGDGVYIVGDDVQPGTYKSEGSESCYWSRNSKSGDIIDNHLGAGPTVMVIKASDFSVTVQRCAPFTKTG